MKKQQQKILWSLKEFECFEDLYIHKKLPLKICLEKLNLEFENNRTNHSLFHVIRKLKNKYNIQLKTHSNVGWDSREVNLLRDSYNKFIKIEDIVENYNKYSKIKRTRTALHSKLSKLNLKLNQWSESETNYLLEIYNDINTKNWEELCSLLNEKFNMKRTKETILGKLQSLDVKIVGYFHNSSFINQKQFIKDLKITTGFFKSLESQKIIKTRKLNNINQIEFSDYMYVSNFLLENVKFDKACEILKIDAELLRTWTKRGLLKTNKIGMYNFYNIKELGYINYIFDNYIESSVISKKLYYSKQTFNDWIKRYKLRAIKVNCNNYISKIDIYNYINKTDKSSIKNLEFESIETLEKIHNQYDYNSTIKFLSKNKKIVLKNILDI